MRRGFLRRAAGGLALAGGAVAVLGPAPALAEDVPRLTLDRTEAAPGDPILVTFEGFDSPFVNIVICGNLAYRGATDCSVTAGVSKETLVDGRPKVVQMIVQPPPVHCPCIVRATASAGNDFAVAPLVITGHPVDDLVGVPEADLVEVVVEPREANQGFWATVRSALGGPTRYEATVSVRNNTTQALTRLALSGSVGHWTDDDAAELDLDPPASLEPGQTWTQDVVAEVSAPTVGQYEFEVIASGAGAAVSGTSTTTHHPFLLYVALAVLVLDIVWMVVRWVARRLSAYDDDPVLEPGSEAPLPTPV